MPMKLLSLFFFVGYSFIASADSPEANFALGQPAQNAPIRAVFGNTQNSERLVTLGSPTMTLDLLRTQKVVVIEVGASWCAPCRLSFPRLAAFAKAQPNIDAIVISIDSNLSGAKPIYDRLASATPSPIVVVAIDPRDLSRELPSFIPFYIVIDRGHVVRLITGLEVSAFDLARRLAQQ